MIEKKKNKQGQQVTKPDINTIVKVIEDNYGIVTECAKTLGISAHTLYNWINASTKLQETLSKSRTRMIDVAERQLMRNILDGKETSLIFFLKTQAKGRGYGQDPIELNHNIKQIIINVPDEETKQLLDNLKFIDNSVSINIENNEI